MEVRMVGLESDIFLVFGTDAVRAAELNPMRQNLIQFAGWLKKLVILYRGSLRP